MIVLRSPKGWTALVHAVYVMSAVGTVPAQFTIDHAAEGIATLTGRVAEHGDPTDVQVGTERPNGRLVDLLLERGHPVVPVSPNAIKTWREGKSTCHTSHIGHDCAGALLANHPSIIGPALADEMIRELARLLAGEGIDVGDIDVPDVGGRIATAVAEHLPADSTPNGNR